jgi:hypothetical protein
MRYVLLGEFWINIIGSRSSSASSFALSSFASSSLSLLLLPGFDTALVLAPAWKSMSWLADAIPLQYHQRNIQITLCTHLMLSTNCTKPLLCGKLLLFTFQTTHFTFFFVSSQIRATYGISAISAICLYIEKKAVT